MSEKSPNAVELAHQVEIVAPEEMNKKGGVQDRMKNALIAILTVVVAGVVLNYFNSKDPHLSYTIAEGPALQVQGAYRRIYELKVANTGRAEAETVLIQMGANGGKIDGANYSATLGLKPSVDSHVSSYSLSIPSLNPGDSVRLAIQASFQSATAKPLIAVRAKGVNGIEEELSVQINSSVLYLEGVAAGVFIMLIFTFSLDIKRLKRRNAPDVPTETRNIPAEKDVLLQQTIDRLAAIQLEFEQMKKEQSAKPDTSPENDSHADSR